MGKRKRVLQRDEWVDIRNQYPKKFQLVTILYESNKTQPGWWTGHNWDAGRDLLRSRVVAWHRMGGNVVER